MYAFASMKIIMFICLAHNLAYTMAKYGMSMCVLGMAEEFRGSIAVNALWPKTGKCSGVLNKKV